MRLYTKTGDKGETGLIGGRRVPKDDPRVATYGDVDELNAVMGLAACGCTDDPWVAQMRTVQDRLFVLGASLADPDGRQAAPGIMDDDVEALERWIDAAEDSTPPLTQFILPGGSELSARLHLARATARRAERSLVALARSEKVGPCAVRYLNRLSDLLFAWARLANTRCGVADIIWRPRDSSK